MIPTWLALMLIGLSGVAGYYYGRLIEYLRAPPALETPPAPLPAPVDPAPEIAAITIRLFGTTTRTEMSIDMPVLEKLANGVGKTLTDQPSKGIH
jgi:hypothetical protein